MSIEVFEFDEQSNCCGASFVENSVYDGVGMCADCFEMAEVELVDEFGEVVEGC